jgi:hypothetical protein
MGSWAERMIVNEVREESKMRHNKIVLQNKAAGGKKQKSDSLDSRFFYYAHVDNEWFWRLIAYAYFVCRTLGLAILIDFYIFKKPDITLFLIILAFCCYFNFKFYKSLEKNGNGNF